MLQVAIHFAQPGDVIIVASGEFSEAGTFGDVLGNACKAKGIAALLLTAACAIPGSYASLAFQSSRAAYPSKELSKRHSATSISPSSLAES